MSQTVDRALGILPLLAEGPAGLGQVADRLGVHQSIDCVAAPVRGADGRVVAAMPVSAPNVVVTADELLTLLPLVRRTADAISGEYSGRTPVKGTA